CKSSKETKMRCGFVTAIIHVFRWLKLVDFFDKMQDFPVSYWEILSASVSSSGHFSMAAASAVIALLSSPFLIPPPKSNASPPPFPSLFHRPAPCPSLPLSSPRLSSPRFHRYIPLKRAPHRGSRFTCRAAEYKFPDPIPDFAAAETDRFRTHMLERLTKKKEHFGDCVGEVVDVCTEVRTLPL
ncbi:hypothetical protein B296_00048486, partial [Ensete ventricosum]